jgi:hypothetical protein
VALANGQIDEPWDFGIKAYNESSGAPVPGVAAELFNGSGTSIVDTVTDALGQISYGSGLYENGVLVRSHTTGSPAPITEYGPFTLKVNHKAPFNPAFFARAISNFDWPGIDYAFGRQLLPVNMPVPLTPIAHAGPGNEEWRPWL